MDSLDTSWCPVCDRQIIPKRFDVPVTQPAAPAPAAAVHAAASAKPSAPLPPTRTKSNCGRARGLVHGTGRARPALKRANSKQGPAPTVATVAPIAPEPTKPDSPVKTKSVIDQSPLPLYCSDDCRLVDLHKLDDGFSYDFNPDRHRPISAVSLSAPSVADSDVESPTGSSDTDSTSSSSSYTHASARSYQEMDPSIATLAAVYGFPSLPPPPPVRPDVAPVPVSNPAEEYVTGIMMAGRRIKETLCPDPPKRSAFSSPSARYTSSLTRSRKPIAGWTDGSDAWRASVYSLSAPRDWTVVDPKNPENRSSAYASCIATPHRSSGVVSTLGEGPSSSVAAALAARPGSKASPDALQELYGDYPLFNTARAESRMRMYPGSPQSLPSRPASQCSGRTTRECGILPKQAEGKLLVPNITLRRNTSSASVASMSSLGSNGPRSPRALTRRGSAMSDDVIHEEDETVRCPAVPSSSLPTTMRSTAARKPVDLPFTYPIMLPMVREKRVEHRVVNGVEQTVEVEVMVPKEVERLFLGPDGVNHLRERRKRAAAEAMRAQAKAARAAARA